MKRDSALGILGRLYLIPIGVTVLAGALQASKGLMFVIFVLSVLITAIYIVIKTK